MSRFEFDDGPRLMENSFESNTSLGPHGLNSHSESKVGALAFPIFCSHFEADKKMLPACSASISALNCDTSPPAYFLLFPCRRLASCFTQFIIVMSSRLIVDVCGERGFWGE